jgi:hypothetical protein
LAVQGSQTYNFFKTFNGAIRINDLSGILIMPILIGIVIGYTLSGVFNTLMMWKNNSVLWNEIRITFNKLFYKQQPDPNHYEPHDKYAAVLPTDYYSAKYPLKTNNVDSEKQHSTISQLSVTTINLNEVTGKVISGDNVSKGNMPCIITANCSRETNE